MTGSIGKMVRAVMNGLACAAVGVVGLTAPALAQDPRIVNSEQYIPGIWIDPDGCEHWAMDDGTEGYMSPRRTRDGRRSVTGLKSAA